MAVRKILQRVWGTAAQIAAATPADREIVINTTDYSAVIGDGVTAGGKTRVRTEPTGATPYSAPATGATITTAQGERYRTIAPAGTIATLTITLPPSPQDGDTWEGSFRAAVTTLTVNAPAGATVLGGGSTQAANSGASWRYRTADTTWSRRF